MITREHDFQAWIETRVGRVEWELMSKPMQEIAHAAFMEGGHSRELFYAVTQLAELPGMKKRMQTVRAMAALQREYLQTMRALGEDEATALAMTIAFIQAQSIRQPKFPKLDDPPKQPWET